MKRTNLTTFTSIALAACAMLLASCGGGGGGSSSSSTPTTTSPAPSATYTASAAAGEVLSYTVDTTALTYSYTITYSAYGLTGKTGSGTLTKNSDGSFTPSESPTSKVYALPNGLLMGAVKLTVAPGKTQVVPIMGVQNPLTTLSDLNGTYNFISQSCPSATTGVPSIGNNCSTNYGTVKLSNGSYYQCSKVNITSSPSCYSAGGNNGSQGTMTSLGGGLYKYIKSGSSSVSYILAFLAPNGDKVIIGDLNDPVVSGVGYGYGQFIGSSQPTSDLTSTQFASQANGTWYYHEIYSDINNPYNVSMNSGTHVITGGAYTNSDGSPSGTTTLNSPWAGFVATNQSNSAGYSLLAGTGVYVWRNNDVRIDGYQVGMHK
jgi:hypothetical protein